ncbi:uncharacterized protein UV8b_00349 [Ustilaginoidea virens]|uniref:Uncharacterized protein n=1 Tax=Ustilaginoidea virens TaxID=1159556 RepID=A0A063BW73_USTVR|nr:uncharacterized protein UV8b_00349 [Ustilaginoidea virens]QUC16108.1 hypothetical protein UV8b_00349 [Ustilaginoidea virens]GAO17141.1 hypothetical protein UVI_02026710 [Ustilaginoidea virens]
MTAHPESNPLEKLTISLSQPNASPPTVRVTVTNRNAYPVTIVSYGSPLDEIALPLGLLHITPSGASKCLDLNVIRGSRIWPPEPHHLIGLRPGESGTNDVVLQAPTVPMQHVGKGATVFLQGKWIGVFPRTKHELTASDLNHMFSQPGSFRGRFRSENLEIAIE